MVQLNRAILAGKREGVDYIMKHGENEKARLDQLLTAVSEGDTDAFRQLYELMKKPVYVFALSMLKKNEDAEDVLQDAFIRIRGAASFYRKGTNPHAWIFTIVRNLSLDLLRRRTDTSDWEEEENHLSTEDVEQDVIGRDEVFRLLSLLRDEEREIVTLYLYGQLTHGEIARVMELPYEQVRWKYAYALKKMRKQIAAMPQPQNA